MATAIIVSTQVIVHRYRNRRNSGRATFMMWLDSNEHNTSVV